VVEGFIILAVLVVVIVFLLRGDSDYFDDPSERVQDAVRRMAKSCSNYKEKVEEEVEEESGGGGFSGIKSTLKKSEAAVVVQNLLEHQARAGMFPADPAKVANKLVLAVWSQKPDMFDGKFGQRPHKISVAAAALANGIFNLDEDNPNRTGLVLALGNLLSEVEVNGRLYPLSSIDHQLLEMAMSTFSELADEQGPAQDNESLPPFEMISLCFLPYSDALRSIDPLSSQAKSILGYFFGALEETCAKLNRPIKDFDDALYQLLSDLYKGKALRAIQRVGQLREQRDRRFLEGEALGKAEFFNWLNRDDNPPTGLHEYIYDFEES
jgi:hypothetical protein